MGYASTQLLSEESARALVRRAVDNAAVLENDSSAQGVPGVIRGLLGGGGQVQGVQRPQTDLIVGALHGDKPNYDAKVGVRPFTMYLVSGELTGEQLLEKAQNGMALFS